jgi:ribonuclease P protein subunit POP4
MPPSNPSGSKKSQSQVAGTRGGSGNVIRVFNFEKTERRAKKVRHRPVENLVRRAGGIKATMAGVKYSQFEPLYELWCGYFAKLLEEVTSKGTGRLDDRILRADYQGCLLRVADAPNPTQVGLNGIVVRESKQTFEMVTRLDKIIGEFEKFR